MSEDWANKIAQQLLSRGLIETGICLILGAADTGKTTLAAALAVKVCAKAGIGRKAGHKKRIFVQIFKKKLSPNLKNS